MKRSILAFVVGLVSWMVAVTLLNWVLRAALPGYVQAEPTMHFTPGMMVARLAIAALTSVIAGACVRLVAPAASYYVPAAVGVLTLALFVPSHVWLWKVFPLWYHVIFLGTLVPLVMLGARLLRRQQPAGPATT